MTIGGNDDFAAAEKMAAVIAPFEQMMEVIKDIPDLAPANFNSPNQTVIAGGTAAVDEAMRRMKEAGIRAVEIGTVMFGYPARAG